MTYFKEIVTKAVVGKGKKTTNQTHKVKPNYVPSTVLGCWLINHEFSGANGTDGVIVNGSYDVNIWYSYDNDTKTDVISDKYTYKDVLNVPLNNDTRLTNNKEVIVNSLSSPSVVDVKINGDEIEFVVAKEMGVEIVGDTKIRVPVEDDYDDYKEIIDNNNFLSDIDNEIKEDYLSDSPNQQE